MRDYAELVKGAMRIQLYRCTGRMLQERKSRVSTKSPTSPLTNTEFTDAAKRDQAFQSRLDELLADGWVDQKPEKPVKTKSTAALEDAFAALAAETIEALAAAKDADDERIWKRAMRTYGRLKTRAGGNPDENLVHFFAVDGIALERKHTVVMKSVRASKARKARWLQLLS